MAEFVMNTITVPLSAITGYGARAKRITEVILSLCDDLAIHNVVSDTADNYSADLSWRGNTSWLIRLANSGSSLYAYLMTQTADGVYESEGSGYAYILSESNAFVELNKYDRDFLLFGIHSGDAIVSFICLRVVDQFTGAEKLAGSASSSYDDYYSFGYLYIVDGYTAIRLLDDKNANGLAKNGIVAAIPMVFYTESSGTPFSGFVAGGGLMYYFYRGTDTMSFNTRHTTLSLGGHEFITLTQKLCVRVN